MRGRRRYFASFIMVLALFTSSLVASGPAQAAGYATAQVNMVTPSGSRTYSLAAGDQFYSGWVGGATGIAWSHGNENLWQVAIRGPHGAPVTVGTYDDATGQSGSDNSRPLLWMSTGITSCSAGSGRFVVNQVELNPDTTFKKLDLYFEHGCGPEPTTFGRVLVDVPVPAISPSPAPSALFAASMPTDPGVLRVYGEATAGVSQLTAHLISPTTGLEVDSTSAFTRQSGTDNLGAWVSSAPFDLTEPGFYRVDTEIEDHNGAHVVQTGVGYLVLRSRSAFQNVALNPNYVDVTRRTTRLTGTLNEILPSTNEIRPRAGASVSALTSTAAIVGTAVTGNDGSFSITVTVTRTESVFAMYHGDIDIAGDRSSPLALTLNQTPSKILTAQAFWGPTMTLSGVATYQSGSQWLPLANQQIEIRDYTEDGYWRDTATTMTDAQGNFSKEHTWTGGGSVHVLTKPSDPFVTSTEVILTSALYQPGVTFQDFAGYWENEFIAQLIGTLSVPGTPNKLPIAIQRQTTDGWQTVSTVMASPTSEQGTWFFVGGVWPPCGHSYWRASYGGGSPGGAVYSSTLHAVRGCPPPRRGASYGSRVPVPSRRGM